VFRQISGISGDGHHLFDTERVGALESYVSYSPSKRDCGAIRSTCELAYRMSAKELNFKYVLSR